MIRERPLSDRHVYKLFRDYKELQSIPHRHVRPLDNIESSCSNRRYKKKFIQINVFDAYSKATVFPLLTNAQGLYLSACSAFDANVDASAFFCWRK